MQNWGSNRLNHVTSAQNFDRRWPQRRSSTISKRAITASRFITLDAFDLDYYRSKYSHTPHKSFTPCSSDLSGGENTLLILLAPYSRGMRQYFRPHNLSITKSAPTRNSFSDSFQVDTLLAVASTTVTTTSPHSTSHFLVRTSHRKYGSHILEVV